MANMAHPPARPESPFSPARRWDLRKLRLPSSPSFNQAVTLLPPGGRAAGSGSPLSRGALSPFPQALPFGSLSRWRGSPASSAPDADSSQQGVASGPGGPENRARRAGRPPTPPRPQLEVQPTALGALVLVLASRDADGGCVGQGGGVWRARVAAGIGRGGAGKGRGGGQMSASQSVNR